MTEEEARAHLYICVSRIGPPPPDQRREYESQFHLEHAVKNTPLLRAGERTEHVSVRR